MTLRFRDRVSDVTTTTGTGTLTLAGTPPAGFRAFTAFPTGSTVRYTIVHENLTEWEVGEGVWTTSGSTLTRAKVYSSTNAGAAVSFTAGTKSVMAAPMARDMERPAFRAFRSASQAVTANNWTKIQLASVSFDTASAFDSTTNYRFQPLVPGYYMLSGQASSATPTNFAVAIYKNGALTSIGGNTNTNTERSTVTDVLYFNGVTDYVELWVYSAGTSVSPNTVGADVYFSGVLVAGAA